MPPYRGWEGARRARRGGRGVTKGWKIRGKEFVILADSFFSPRNTRKTRNGVWVRAGKAGWRLSATPEGRNWQCSSIHHGTRGRRGRGLDWGTAKQSGDSSTPAGRPEFAPPDPGILPAGTPGSPGARNFIGPPLWLCFRGSRRHMGCQMQFP